jgi:hypothetical protein
MVEARSVSDALAEYNAFHDAFIRSIEVRSFDRFTSIGTQRCTGAKQVRLVISHYNYPPWNRGRTIVATFGAVKALRIESSGAAMDWTIREIVATGSSRASDRGGEEACIQVTIRQARMAAGVTSQAEDIVFSCDSVQFRERRGRTSQKLPPSAG